MINYAVPVLKVNFIFLFVYNNKKKTLYLPLELYLPLSASE